MSRGKDREVSLARLQADDLLAEINYDRSVLDKDDQAAVERLNAKINRCNGILDQLDKKKAEYNALADDYNAELKIAGRPVE